MIGCRPLSSEELADVLVALSRKDSGLRDAALMVLGVTTGFRISELLSLKIRDVTHGGSLNSHVRIPQSRMKGKKRSRSALLAPVARDYLAPWLELLKASGRDGANLWLFPSRKGALPISRIQAHRILADAFAVAGIDGSFGELGTHCMRKTFAARMWVAHNGNIWKVQNALGHASPASTVAYLSFNEDEQRDAVESVFADI